jgi:hypothetical protein
MQKLVDLVINTFERTYRRVLAPGFFPNVERQNQRSFARKVALINNLADLGDAKRRADQLLRLGEIDEYHVVAERLGEALAKVGLKERDLGRVLHYSDCSLVAVALPGAPFLLYWDAEIQLLEPADWVGPALELMEENPAILVANPEAEAMRPEFVGEEVVQKRGDFLIGYGFSDQVYLVRRCDLARPIYKCRCPASLRFPMAHIGSIFEKRVDSYMRTHKRLRASYTRVFYFHPQDPKALTYPAPNRKERLKLKRNEFIIKILCRSPLKDPCWKLGPREIPRGSSALLGGRRNASARRAGSESDHG